jgi:uncharacterized membrane protein
MSIASDGSVASTAPGGTPSSGAQPARSATDVIPPGPVGGAGHARALFRHTPHLHQIRNVNLLHKAEQAAEGANTKIAIALTQTVGTMWTAYTFVLLAVIGLFAILGWLDPVVALLVAWTSQTLIQLVLLPVIMVGQNVLGRKSELQADEQFNTTMSTYHDIEQIMQHLSAQDEELLKHTEHLSTQYEELLKHTEMLLDLLQSSGLPPEKLAELKSGPTAQSNNQGVSGAGSNTAPADTPLDNLGDGSAVDGQRSAATNEDARS